ncbi:hypothetical protein B0J11DRAFT_504390 [Dendryphion nanum]|uniref:Uncharacterized protein n=1 Tax=Dendryphion nanum TaxID=256645 RepID=A0A9P9ITR2_9PLEO|nr:hypothetical protein B0J11DRAFT_504390 [Dendryphion nanum]
MSSSSGIIQAAQAPQADRSLPTPSQKGRHFFQKVQPTFSVSPGIAQLEFVDNSDPRKDAVVRKKAREWVFRNREVTKGKRNVTFKKHGAELDNTQQRKVNKKKDKEVVISLFDPSSGRIDPFGMLPDVGRKVDHIIEFYHSTRQLRLHFLTSSIVVTRCPEQVPGSEDREAWISKSLMARTSNENTVLGVMATERISFILWLHATTLLKDGMDGIFGSPESWYFYRLALQAMQEELDRTSEQYSDAFLVAMACFSACANFTGDYRASRVHRDALIKAVMLRGNGDLKKGLQSCKPWTQRAMTWCEVHAAAQTPSVPLLPYTPPPSKETVPEAIVQQTSHLTALTLSHVPPLSAPFEPLILQLHQLGLLQPLPSPKNSRWPEYYKADPAGIRPLYRAEYMILQLLAAQEQEGHSFTPFEIMFSNACQLFLWPAVRGLPPEMKMCDLFVERLQKAVIPLLISIRGVPLSLGSTKANISPVDPFYVTSDLTLAHASYNPIVGGPSSPPTLLLPVGPLDYPIIWALYLGTLMTTVGERPQYGWFKEQLVWMTLKRNAHVFRTSEDLKNVLKIFPYTEAFCGVGIPRVGLNFSGHSLNAA